jgi:RecJ-like exonuclease
MGSLAGDPLSRVAGNRVVDRSPEVQMARVKMEEIVDHLSAEIKRALERAVERTCPDARFDSHELFREFRSAVRSKCRTWEHVPDQYVDQD